MTESKVSLSFKVVVSVENKIELGEEVLLNHLGLW